MTVQFQPKTSKKHVDSYPLTFIGLRIVQFDEEKVQKYIPVCKIFSLFSCANELNNGKKLLMAIKFFLFFQYQPKKYEKSIEP